MDPEATPPKKSHKKLLFGALVVVILVILGVGGIVLDHSNDDAEKTTTVATKTNTWTGKAGSYKWSEANNWSNGEPSNGQTLTIDVAHIKLLSGSTAVIFNNDINNLSLKKLIFTGKTSNIIAEIGGNGFSVSDGIDDMVNQGTTNAAVPQITFRTTVTFAGDSTVTANGYNHLVFGTPDFSAAAAIGTSTVNFKASEKSSISFFGPVTGTGALRFATGAIGPQASVLFYRASPDFSGSVAVGNGDLIGVGEGALGNATIQVDNGGALSLFATGQSTYTLANDITMLGEGTALVSTSNVGDHSGALSACITVAQQGCDAGVTVKLTGKVTLLGDTQLGALYGGEDGARPTGTTVTYSFSNLIKGAYTLTTIPDSLAVIQ